MAGIRAGVPPWHRRSALGVWVLLIALIWPTGLAAQERPDGERLAQERARVAALPDLDEATREELLGDWDEALAQLDVLAGLDEQFDELDARVRTAPAQLEALRARLAEARAQGAPPTPQPAERTVEAVKPQADLAEADLAAARQRLTDLQQERSDHDQQRVELPGRISAITERIDGLQAELTTLGESDTDPERRAAEEARIGARLAVANAELAEAEARLAGSDALGELLDGRIEEAQLLLTRADTVAKAWRDQLNAVRAEEAQAAVAAAEAARQALIDSDPTVKKIADRNAELARMRAGEDGLATKLAELPERTDKVLAEVRALDQEFRSVKEKVAAVGLTPAIGVLLVEQRRDLEDLRDTEESVRARSAVIDAAQLDRIDRREELGQLSDVGAIIEQTLGKLDLAEGSDERAAMESTLRELLEAQRASLVTLRAESQQYFEQLEKLDSAERKLLELTAEFSAYLDERVLRVRIAPPLHAEPERQLERARAALDWLLDPEAWSELVRRSSARGPSDPLKTALQGLVLLVLLLLRPLLVRRIGALAELVSRIRTDRFVYTVRALVFTVVLAVTGPLMLWFAASLAEPEGASGELARAVAAGLRAVAVAWFLIELIRKVCRPRGLAEAHFRWAAPGLLTVRRHTRWLLVIGLPLMFVHAVLDRHTDDGFRDSLGRLSFLTAELALAVFLALVLRPGHGALRDFFERHPTGWLSRLRWIWFPVAVGLPLTLAAQAWLGYWYTALQLQERLRWTSVLVLSVIVGHALVMRWLYVTRRQLAMAQAFRRRAQADAGASRSQDGEPRTLSGEHVDEPDDLDIDVGAMSEQSRRLVQTSAVLAMGLGLFLIWVDVLPALRILDEFDLWTHTTEIEEVVPAAGGGEETVLRRTRVPVTVADLVLALLAVALTAVAARNLPGLLEISVLQRLPMTRAGRYAFTSLTRYTITVLGIVLAFGAVGVSWSTVQWLAAGVSVGLGFGLQEIFANFVSGLIILFERPVRVGDTVTVSGVIGTVTRIHMRATTIQTWDRTEFVVPNREFITGQLVNWTLTDSVMRVIVSVGVAYGSDTELATRILHEIAEDNPDVLGDPSPRVVFTQFGDSTLDFELRFYVDDPELYRVIHHSLNMEIDRRFREAGIEIAFPQRDLHVRSFEVPVPLQGGPAPERRATD